MKKILSIILLLLMITPTQAVLNESDLVKTLEVLRDELEHLYKEQQENLAKYKQFDTMQHEKMLKMIQESNQTALILYSQKQDYIFNLTYACNEATRQYRDFTRQQEPYFKILERIELEIDRYEKLIDALVSLPPRYTKDTNIGNVAESVSNNEEKTEIVDSTNIAIVDSLVDVVAEKAKRSKFLLAPSHQAERDSCIEIVNQIRKSLIEVHDAIKEDYDQYIAIGEKMKVLNDYALNKYQSIQQNIFKNGETSFISMLARPKYYWNIAVRDIKDKYVLTGEERVKSDWKGPVVLIFTFFAIFYLAIVIILCNIVIRFLLSNKFKGELFEKRKNYIITACSMVLFSIVLFIMSYIIDDNFFKMASSLLVEFTLLMSAIVASLLFRIDANKLRYGYRLYFPVMAMGFFVIFVRIIFVPNSVVSLLFPPLLLIATLFQFDGVKKYSTQVESADRFYTWISFATIAVSCIASWCGFTLLAVQIFMWWMIQLTCIHGITCCYDAMKIYEDKILRKSIEGMLEDNTQVEKVMKSYHKQDGKFFQYTWIGDLINMTVIPLLAVLSVPVCIYWASDIFDMSDTCATIFFTDFVKVPDVFELSIAKIVTVSSMYFIFKFLNYILRSSYNHYVEKKTKANQLANITLGNNLISIVVWGAFFIISLILMNIPGTGISIVTAGLATGVGFAMKDVLNNFFYGMSLMAGRVRVGEMIECDGIRGIVHSITYQSTQIQTLDGSILAFLNSNLFAKSFKNLTRNHDYELVKLPIGVAYGTNIERVREVLIDKIREFMDKQSKDMPDIDPSKNIVVALNGFGDSSVDLYVVLWVRLHTKLMTCSKINEIIYNTLNENNIEIPFPQRDVHVRDMVKQ
ncbi:MAG: mechanosensitive ion channel [Bacteroidales bacterium]|nr:mechanosensitive ion channel [Bacteroidales bacterium]